MLAGALQVNDIPYDFNKKNLSPHIPRLGVALRLTENVSEERSQQVTGRQAFHCIHGQAFSLFQIGLAAMSGCYEPQNAQEKSLLRSISATELEAAYRVLDHAICESDINTWFRPPR